MDKLFELKSVTLGYGRRVVLKNFSLLVHEGEFWAIVGPNGSGKTTLLAALMNLVPVQTGELVCKAGITFGYCVQRQMLNDMFPLSVYDVVMMAHTRSISSWQRPGADHRQSVLKALEMTAIAHLSDRHIRELSGGEKQRVLIARALTLDRDVLVLDEPTADLDLKVEREIMALIEQLRQKTKCTVLMVTHEINEVINIAERFLFLGEDQSYDIFSRADLDDATVSRMYKTPLKIVGELGKKIVVPS